MPAPGVRAGTRGGQAARPGHPEWAGVRRLSRANGMTDTVPSGGRA